MGSLGRVVAIGVALLIVAAGPAAAQAAAGVAAQGQHAFDGNPSTTERVNTSDPIGAAVAVSQLRFPTAGSASTVVLSRVDLFADSLAGAPLLGDAPLLFAFPNGLPEATLNELQRVAAEGATVYLLGGEHAIQPVIEQQVTDLGYAPVRLAGPSRVETSVAIAREVFRLAPSRTELAVVRAEGTVNDQTGAWADSISGGAWTAYLTTPLVLTPTGELHPAVQEFLSELQPGRTYVFGGTAAVSEAVASQLPNVSRVAGANRAETAAAVVPLFGSSTARYILINGYKPSGWQLGLAAVGIAADAAAPLLYSQAGQIPAPTLQRLTRPCDSGPGLDTLLVGAADVLPESLIGSIDAADGAPCPPPPGLIGEWTGSTSFVSEPFTVTRPLVRFEMSFNGSGNFIVHLLDESGDTEVFAANEIGTYSGTSWEGLDPGTYRLEVEHGSGSWGIQLTEPSITTGDGLPVTYSGNGDTAAGTFSAPGGFIQFDYNYSGESNFIVHAISVETGQIEVFIANEIDSASGTDADSLDPGLYVIDVDADEAGSWEVSVHT